MVLSLTDVFSSKALKRRKEIKKELKRIRSVYRKERGFLKGRKMTDARILELYQFFPGSRCNTGTTEIDTWKKFVRDCEEGGADFLEQL